MGKKVRPARGRPAAARPSEPALSRFVRSLFAPTDITPLVYFRISFGVLSLVLMVIMLSWGFVHRYYIEPKFHFKYLGFGWVEPWTGSFTLPLVGTVHAMHLHFVALALLSAMIAAGFLYRLSALLFCIGYTHVFLIERARYLNHYYLVCLIAFLLIFIPAHRRFSVDAWLRPRLRSGVAPVWTLWLLRLQIGIVYFYAGLAKFDADWLQGAPMRLLLARRRDFAVIGPWVDNDLVIAFFAYGGLLLDLFVFPALLFKRTRWFALAASVGFHLLNSQLFYIDIFPWFMLSATFVLFFPDKLPFRRDTPAPAAPPPSLLRSQRLTAGFLAVYVAVQLLVPLRHHLYAGNTNWINAGHSFSWRMLLRVKTPLPLRFVEVFRDGDQVIRQEIQGPPPEYWQTHWQLSKMALDPDMILQYVHFFRDERRRRGFPDVAIYAQVPISLNGRPPELLIDPMVNLAAERRRPGPYPWVLPLTQPLPEEMRLW